MVGKTGKPGPRFQALESEKRVASETYGVWIG
jgi:hypothetical protein